MADSNQTKSPSSWLSKVGVAPTTFSLLLGGMIEPFLLVLAAFTLVHLLADAADRFGIMSANSAISSGIEYLLLRIPNNLTRLLPVSLLAGVMFGFANMNRTGEIVAMQASGVSRVQLAAPLILLATVVTGLDFFISEVVVPVTNARAEVVLVKRVKKQRFESSRREAWIRTRDGFIFAGYYNPSRKELRDITIFRFEGEDELRLITRAQSANWSGSRWRFGDSRSFDLGDGDVANTMVEASLLDTSPADFEAPSYMNPDELSLAGLNRFLGMLERRGISAQRYLAVRDLKYALPVSCLILAAIGFALSLDPLPRHGGLARKTGYALAAGFGYWLILGFTMSFGKTGVLPHAVAAWLPNFVFGAIALSMFLMGEEG